MQCPSESFCGRQLCYFLDHGGTLRQKLYSRALVTLCALYLLTWPGKRVEASPPGDDSSVPVCGVGTIAGYIGNTCSQPPTVFHWISYSCTSTPASICQRLGNNGREIHVRLDPNGPNTLLVGGTHLSDVSAGQSVDIMIRGSVYNANVNSPGLTSTRTSAPRPVTAARKTSQPLNAAKIVSPITASVPIFAPVTARR